MNRPNSDPLVESPDAPGSSNRNRGCVFPLFSAISVIAMPLVGFASVPFWNWYVDRQITSTPSEIYAPDPGQFGGFAVVAGAVASGAIGAVLGLCLAWWSKRRMERWQGLRVAAFVLNALGVLIALVLLTNYVLTNSS